MLRLDLTKEYKYEGKELIRGKQTILSAAQWQGKKEQAQTGNSKWTEENKSSLQ